MFIEKLTVDDLKKFFNTQYVSCFMSKDIYGEEYLYASTSLDEDAMTVNRRLYDFEGSTVANETKWRRFLYTKFGNEYIEEYKKYLDNKSKDKLMKLVINTSKTE